MAQNRYKATVAGQTYTIIGQETKQHMDMVLALVNEQLNEIKDLSPEITAEKAAILLAINAVSDQVKKQEELLQLKKHQADLKRRAARSVELENKIKKIEAIEAEAKSIMQQNGQNNAQIRNHVEAQQVVNENRKREIQKRAANK
ncbi:cell division protein ZapA [Enterococcus sp. 669A]|uniref:Cell division protein ZapA n=1 Tax=Candidatus Enterococcus moelleringii TaxID=2815325 RepID=A0ABS3LFP2_9ENTE|nr:cell division protein ZapA [Enterococcus sp. 669A]MBO1308456.1 cell division protein ZapA [Enterococcus sp. 669A]